MNPKTIKLIDYWLGIPLTWLLTVFSIRKFTLNKPSKILFIKLIEQGATILAIPGLQRAIQLVGRENVYFLVFPENRPVLDVLNIIPSENILEISGSSFFKFIKDTFKALSFIRKTKIDTTIDMEFFSRFTAVFAFFCGAQNRVGYHRYTSELPMRGNLMTHKVQYNPYIHVSVAYYLLVESTILNPGIIPFPKVDVGQIKLSLPEIKPQPEDIENIRNMIQLHGVNPDNYKIIILNPNAGDMLPLRKWNNANYLKLAEKLLIQYQDILIIFTGNDSEKDIVHDLCCSLFSDRAISLAGETSLKELFALYYISELLVTNDSGPAHFASTTNINILTLFGPETPTLFSPLSNKAHNIRKNLSCSPCVSVLNQRFSPCNDNVCMKQITVDEVFEKILEIINH
ncbi:MAG: glycosyltransferase family 9 protein [Bacteroidota bacterium]|nr:glycosyltransferase family 9 protein [Bacteroidota bacterium]